MVRGPLSEDSVSVSVRETLCLPSPSLNRQVNVPRRLNAETQAELVRVVFETFGASAVNLTHQSVLCLLSYNATSGIVVDIGERIDIVPIMDGQLVTLNGRCCIS